MLSVIIPTLNEEKYIGQLLQTLVKNSFEGLQIIVVDGGSQDDTLKIVKGFHSVICIDARRGRSSQMNIGAKVAENGYLLFLHADTHLKDTLVSSLPRLITKTKAGAFSMKFDEASTWLKIYAWFTQWNWTAFTYGDQGLLVEKSLFNEIGGFKDISLLEDLDIVQRLKKKVTFTKFKEEIITSARRFKKNGAIRQQLLNVIIVVSFYLGFKPDFLARYYRY